jgi:hypothetical protein
MNTISLTFSREHNIKQYIEQWRKGSHQNMIGLTVEILHHRGVNLEEFTFSSNN